MNKQINLGILALGQCGTTIGNLFTTKFDVPIMSLNSTYNDSIKGTNITNRYLILDGRLQGMAKKPQNLLEALKEEKEKFTDALTSFIEENSLEAIVLIAGSGGGTGNGLMRAIAKSIDELDGDIKMRCIVITPSFRDGLISLENTVSLLTELQNYNTSIRIISNNNYLYEADEIKKKEVTNRYILNTEFELFSSGSKESLTNNLDYAEISDLMFSKGCTSIYHLNSKELENGTSELFAKTKKSFDVEINSKKVIGSCAYIYKGSRETLSKINETIVEETLGIPTSKYSSLYESSEEEIYFIVSECEMADTVLNYKEECEKLIASKKQMSLIDLQVDRSSEDKTGKDKIEIKTKSPTLKLGKLGDLKGKLKLTL